MSDTVFTKGNEGAVKAQLPHFDLITDTWHMGENTAQARQRRK